MSGVPPAFNFETFRSRHCAKELNGSETRTLSRATIIKFYGGDWRGFRAYDPRGGCKGSLFFSQMNKYDITVDFGGIVVFAPDRLVDYFGKIEIDANIYKTFITSDDGEKVVEQGIVLPILGINDSHYPVFIRYADEEPQVRPGLIIFENRGFPLFVRDRCVIADLGAFLEWSPPDGWIFLDIRPGFYNVTVRGYRDIKNGQVVDFGFELVFTRTEMLPKLTATLTQDMQVLSLP